MGRVEWNLVPLIYDKMRCDAHGRIQAYGPEDTCTITYGNTLWHKCLNMGPWEESRPVKIQVGDSVKYSKDIWLVVQCDGEDVVLVGRNCVGSSGYAVLVAPVSSVQKVENGRSGVGGYIYDDGVLWSNGQQTLLYDRMWVRGH